MTTIADVTRARALAQRDALYVAAIIGVALVAGSMLLLNHGSFARALAAIGLSPVN